LRRAKVQTGVATKEKKREARGLIEHLESRVHAGPPIHANEIHSAREFLRQCDFSPASDYFSRLGQVQHRLVTRAPQISVPAGKRNYGGEASGRWMQLQSAYDHVILSTCYEGVFNLKNGRIKISHRFNQQGRIDFVELKFLRSLHSCLNGELRKLITIKAYQAIRKDWHSAEAFVLPVLPQELIFLFEEVFRSPKQELFAWLINIGHGLVQDLLTDLAERPPNGYHHLSPKNPDQLCLTAVRTDPVALPVLESAARLESGVELDGDETAVVRYYRK
jgi:hypothetical protein